MVKDGVPGEILVGSYSDATGAGVEILALHKGPGIPHFDAVLDFRSTYMRSADDLAAKARRHLTGLRAALPAGMDWSAWMVDVHDARGRHVVYVDFDPAAGWGRERRGPTDDLAGG